MQSADPLSPEPAEEIGASRFLSVLSFGLVGAGLLLFLLGVIAGRSGQVEPGSIGPFLLLPGCLVLAYGIWQQIRWWRNNKRLRIAADRIQLVQGEAEVIGDIPYDNVAKITAERIGRSGLKALVRLVDPGRKDWSWPQPPGFRELLHSSYGYDVVLLHEIGWRDSADVICDKIQERLDRWRATAHAAAANEATRSVER